LAPEKSLFFVLLLILKIKERGLDGDSFLFARGVHHLLRYAVAFGQTMFSFPFECQKAHTSVGFDLEKSIFLELQTILELPISTYIGYFSSEKYESELNFDI
jgi:hypothetical protein